MFNKEYGNNKLAFLPIEWVGKNEEQRKQIIKKLLDIRKHNVILLVDADKAGDLMKKSCEGTALDSISLKDVDINFKEVESLFSERDQKKYDINNKSINSSSILKNFVNIS